jgi:phosphoribosyl 1,2-cyclic phosphodiesterase
VALARDGAAPSLVLDAGTGIRGLAMALDGAPFRGSLLLTHLHWDHVEGLPFCTAMDRPDARTDVLLPAQPDGTGAAAALGRMMSPPNFPIGPDSLLGSWTFSTLDPGTHDREGYTVTAMEIAHKGGTTFGYRIADRRTPDNPGPTLAYLPDHCPTAYGPGPEGWGDFPLAVVDLVRGVDILIHDAQLTADQLPDGAAYGHAAMEYAVALGARAGASTVVLFHHSPSRTDDRLDEIAARYCGHRSPAVVVAVEGTVVDF